MALAHSSGRRSPSPPSSGRSSPVPRTSRRVAEEGVFKADKSLRRYGAAIERALASWEVSPQEWADYIAFLSRLLKAIQSHPKDVPLLPHSASVASKLAQCLNPALPSGVHQKALEIYDYIFATFGGAYLSGHLHEFLPGLSSVLSFASLSIRPGLYTLLENYVVRLPAATLRPVLKSLILSMLPALEEETSEDFERALNILESLEEVFSSSSEDKSPNRDQDGYFWQCLFLAVITSPSRRQGALHFLTRKLPNFGAVKTNKQASGGATVEDPLIKLSPAADTVASPEPGLLIRCFVCGLSDSQILVQRGFLDLLVTHVPLNSPLLQERVGIDDLDRLVSAAVRVLLRREMGLNRRLWTWFQSPGVQANATDSQPSSPTLQRKQSTNATSDKSFRYFEAYGRAPLERCVLAMLQSTMTHPSELAQPFRICLSLLDRWDIGGSVVPHMFLPSMKTVYNYSLTASSSDVAEVVRSASLYFDGIEARLIWTNLFSLLRRGLSQSEGRVNLQTFEWIIRHFNVKDEEMLTVHIPYAIIYLLSLLVESEDIEPQATNGPTTSEIVSMLLNLIPERAFVPTTKAFRTAQSPSVDSLDTKAIRNNIDQFYDTKEHLAIDQKPFGSEDTTQLLHRLIRSMLLRSLNLKIEQSLCRSVGHLVALYSKLPMSYPRWDDDVLKALLLTVDSSTAEQQTLDFSTINSVILLLIALSSSERRTSFAGLLSNLTIQIWAFLSPSSSKFHVEATRSLWQLQDLIGEDDCLQATLTSLVRQAASTKASLGRERALAVSQFAVLWTHTVPAQSSITRSAPSAPTRRSSALAISTDAKQASQRRDILTEPLMIVLDLLKDRSDASYDVVSNWLSNLPTMHQIFAIHMDLMLKAMASASRPESIDNAAMQRHRSEGVREVEYILSHFVHILRTANDWIWQCLEEVSISGTPGGHHNEPTTDLVILAETAVRLLRGSTSIACGLDAVAIELLDILCSGPAAASLKPLELDSQLIELLMKRLSVGNEDLQGSLLRVIMQTLKVRVLDENPNTTPTEAPRSSLSIKGPSVPNARLSSGVPTVPPRRLLECIRVGFSCKLARPHLDQWLAFLSSVLPVYADAIFAGLIPLVECLCSETDKAHRDLVSLTTARTFSKADSPEPTILALLDALETVLARAHECLTDESNIVPVVKPATQQRSLLGNVTSSMFKADGPPSRTAQANSRLTVILAFQDGIRVCVKLWIWASHYTEVDDFDRTSAATTSNYALRIRNRTRHLLEQMSGAEPLESLEIIIYHWCYTEAVNHPAAALDLLHVLQGSRPKSVVPAILDALCSRTNISALPPARQSSLTPDLTALDVSLFLSAYLRSIEDDATDEVWSDCLAFLRDVLANPLPYRQVLPSLLSAVLLLAQKIGNTNFGEQRKMRRDLGDVFLRLLTATFTTMPTAHILEPAANDIKTASISESNASLGRRNASLDKTLKPVIADIEAVLETPDRITSAINSITSSLIGPLFHAKTFPNNITTGVLGLLLHMAKKAPTAKPWRKELLDAFNDAKLFASPVSLIENGWSPLLYQWCLHDKERMPELLLRLSPPSSAGIMFGVGASAARLEADRKTQLNLRRICLLLLSAPEDTFVAQARNIEEKLVELFEASPSSSPSSLIKAELFILCRAIVLSTSAVHLAPLWPVINDSLQSALTSLLPNATNGTSFSNLSLLQACKLLDLLVAVSPDEFQLHEWLYISDTIDAVYHPIDWAPSALSDQIAESLASDASEERNGVALPMQTISYSSGPWRPLIDNESISDKEDIKAMPRDDFARTVLQPFLSQLSIHAYEGIYSMERPDMIACKRNLLEDLMDLTTIVE